MLAKGKEKKKKEGDDLPLDLSGDVGGSEGNDHTGADNTSLDTADGNCANTGDLVDILEGQTQGLVGGTDGGLDSIDGLQQGLTGDLAGLDLLLPTLVPGAVGGGLKHVVTVEAGDGNEGNVLGVEADLLDEVGGLLDNLSVTRLGPLASVHLVQGNDELADTEGEGKQSVLTGLAILGDTSLELTSAGGDDENSAIGLGGTSDHVLDEVTVTGGINDGNLILGGLELPESDIDGDTTLTLGLELVKNPGVLEGTLSELSSLLWWALAMCFDEGEGSGSYLLELLDGTSVDTTTLVDQVSGGGGLAGIDVADNDDVDVRLLVLTVKREKTCQLDEVRGRQDRTGRTNPMVTVF